MDGPSTARPRRQAAALIVALWVGTALLASLPSRLALARHGAQFGARLGEHLLFGLLIDLRDGLPTQALAASLIGLALAAARRRPQGLGRLVRRAALASSLLLYVPLTIGWVAATEFRIERGLYPTRFDLATGLQDTGYVLSSLGVLGLDRFAPSLVLSALAFAGLWLGARRALRRSEGGGGATLLALLGAVAALTAACFGLHRASPLLARTIENHRILQSPLVRFFGSLGGAHENVRLGAVALFRRLALPGRSPAEGAAAVGLPPSAGEAVDRTDCDQHPLARPLDGEPLPAGPGGQVIEALDDLSGALFDGRPGPVRVWHVALESFRADDVHALEPRAPRGVAPFMTSLYERAAGDRPTAIAARHMLQAGARTSQGLSALLCGLGTLPYGLSAARDLGLLPLRCLPDVLRDAGFEGRFYYGSNPGFDNMLPFVDHHGFTHKMTEHSFVEKVPHRGWAVPDAIVFEQAFADAQRSPAGASQYSFVLSLTNHHPFDRPEDFPPAIEERVRQAVAASGEVIGDDDRRRLETFSYSDLALEQLVAAVEKAEQPTLLVASGDHSTADRFLWRHDAPLAGADRQQAFARIPFVVVVPEALLARSDRPRAEDALRRLDRLMSTTALSENDVPRMILALLSRSAPLASVPAPWRWHSLGGQATSPHFRPAARPGAALLGVDASTELFAVDASGQIQATGEAASYLTTADEALVANPTLQPTAELLARFLRGYAASCWPTSVIRGQR